jgi:anti-sigma factor RsiW
MTDEQQLKLQSFLDGELPEDEAREVASWLARDAEATGLLNELRNTRKAIKASEANVRLPESREFFWSKIEREIQRLEPVPQTAERVSPFAFLRRLLAPSAAFAVFLIAGLVAVRQMNFGSSGNILETETALADSSAFTYRDYSAGVTLVWLPYPAEKDLAQPPLTASLSIK